MTTHTGTELADFIDAIIRHDHARPRVPLSALASMDYLPFDYAVLLRQVESRLRSMPALDEIDVAPARTTDPGTSKAAARGITVDNARGKIALAFYRDRVFYDGPGLTATAAVRVAKLEHQAAPWKRVSELKEAKIIAPTGRRLPGNGGQRQEELRLTDFGVAEVRRVFPLDATMTGGAIRS